MPIIDSRSDSKFDALVRTNKDDSLMSFIMATSTVGVQTNRKELVAKHLKSAYELFRENVRGSDSGAGTYGDGSREISQQFESHYTMGYEMGIWEDSDFHLNQLAKRVARYELTVSEYIGIVFFNLFSFYGKNGKVTYHHFLLEILNRAQNSDGIDGDITKTMIAETLPITKATEQANIIFNYLVASDIFTQTDKATMKLSAKWLQRKNNIRSLCNVEYKELSQEEANGKFSDKLFYANYVTKIPKAKEFADIVEDNTWIDTDIIDHDTNYYESDTNFDSVERLQVGTNTLLYGVPGAGKSYTIEHEYMNKENPRERLVFHPDYTYSDFVGQILPVVHEDADGNKNVSYEFTPGPFTTILKDAYTNPMVEHFLVIEEINRGNAPAIFGEIFQLLDRKTEIDPIKDDGFPLFTSEYEISNTDIANFVYGDKRHKIRIPANLSIIGTMNTSDQNVFTLDTAFQRRWNMRLIENVFKKDDQQLADSKILDTSVTWRKFCESINNIILDKNVRMTSSEDKRLGTHFIHIADLQPKVDDERHNRLFPEKVIKYLWDDAFKFTREEIFDISNFNSLEKVIRAFIDSEGNKKFNIFSNSVKDILLEVQTNTTEQAD